MKNLKQLRLVYVETTFGDVEEIFTCDSPSTAEKVVKAFQKDLNYRTYYVDVPIRITTEADIPKIVKAYVESC